MDQEKIEKTSMIRNTFRRCSSSEHGGKDYIESKEMLSILNRLGQPVNTKELDRFMDTIDIAHSGHLDFEGFSKVCGKFLTEPAALQKFKGDEFVFKHLISLQDFETP